MKITPHFTKFVSFFPRWNLSSRRRKAPVSRIFSLTFMRSSLILSSVIFSGFPWFPVNFKRFYWDSYTKPAEQKKFHLNQVEVEKHFWENSKKRLNTLHRNDLFELYQLWKRHSLLPNMHKYRRCGCIQNFSLLLSLGSKYFWDIKNH